MEKGIASHEIKMSEKGTNQAFRTGVKKGREVVFFLFFLDLFLGERAGGR